MESCPTTACVALDGDNLVRIVLLHAPPWKIPSSGEARDPADGPPASHPKPGVDDADFCTIPYGLLSLAAQALRAGHKVAVFNISAFPWRDVDLLIRRVPGRLSAHGT